jgi:hypothetical protein
MSRPLIVIPSGSSHSPSPPQSPPHSMSTARSHASPLSPAAATAVAARLSPLSPSGTVGGKSLGSPPHSPLSLSTPMPSQAAQSQPMMSRLQVLVADMPIFPANVNLSVCSPGADTHSPTRNKFLDKHLTPPRSPSATRTGSPSTCPIR